MLEILLNPNPLLRLIAQPVETTEILEPNFQAWLEAMIETMLEAKGVGLAAPQVGVSKRVIIVQSKKGPEIFINPKIISASLRKIESEEGCLSIPGVSGFVKRHSKIKVRALNRHGEKVFLKATAPEAIIFQHEIDHLNGILFIDKARNIS